MPTRREFLSALPAVPLIPAAPAPRPLLRFGLITDVHHDVMPDGPERVAAFADAVTRAGADFVCQLGDFCQPRPENRDCLKALERFRGDRYHVLGNHDMDGGVSREDVAPAELRHFWRHARRPRRLTSRPS